LRNSPQGIEVHRQAERNEIPQERERPSDPFPGGTEFGPVHGEVIILPSSTASPVDLGIEVKVKQVTVKREFFGLERWGKVLQGSEEKCTQTSSPSQRTVPVFFWIVPNTKLSEK